MGNFNSDFTNAPENADKYSAQAFSPSCSDSMSVAIQIDTNSMGNAGSGNYTVLGSNVSALEADMIPVKDESGSSGSFAMGTAFVKQFFPYKYIGIKYAANGDVAAGTFSVKYETKVQRVNIA